MSVTKQATRAIDLKEDRVRYYKTEHSKILKRNDQKGPIVVHLDKREWATIQDEFGEAECGGNLPVGWILWCIFCKHSRLLQTSAYEKVGLRKD